MPEREELETAECLAYLFKGPEGVQASVLLTVEAWLLVAKGKGATLPLPQVAGVLEVLWERDGVGARLAEVLDKVPHLRMIWSQS